MFQRASFAVAQLGDIIEFIVGEPLERSRCVGSQIRAISQLIQGIERFPNAPLQRQSVACATEFDHQDAKHFSKHGISLNGTAEPSAGLRWRRLEVVPHHLSKIDYL